MNRVLSTLLAAIACLASAAPAAAAEYKCVGDRVEKSSSTVWTLRQSSSGWTIEKSGSTVGTAVNRGSAWHVEVSGSTKAMIKGDVIEKSGSTWAKVSDAKAKFDCPDVVAATLWVLQQIGQI